MESNLSLTRVFVWSLAIVIGGFGWLAMDDFDSWRSLLGVSLVVLASILLRVAR